MAKYLFTSESVTEGHPDKICDQISDAVLDSILEQDPNGRVACETTVTTGMVMVMGEISTSCYVDIPKIARQVIRDIGYDRAKFGFDCDTCGIITSIDEQSCDIAMGVDKGLEAKNANSEEEDNGAGDQGMMFGFACDDTPELMPMPISLAHKLAKQLAKVRKDGTLDYLRPDGKTQVTIEYENEVPVAVETIVISNQHSPEVEMEQLRADIKKYVIDPIVPQELMTEQTKIFINPTGRFVIGGPQGDSGLTGRKIIVDTYGGMGRHGGGAFSGKDPTKVDRSAAYAARYVAKNIVAAKLAKKCEVQLAYAIGHGGGAFSGKDPTKVDRSAAYAARYVAKNIVAAKLAKKCEVQLAYAIGVAKPVSINVNTFGTGAVADEQLEKAVEKVFDLRPTAIINSLGLRRPIYRQLAAYGHMGREDLGVSWEKTDKVDALLAAVK